MGEPGAAPSPGEARRATTAARLLDAARDVFSETGYASARVEDIVTRAGVSHGTFYTHYPNKAAVLDALVRRSAGRIGAIAETPWVTEGGADARVDVERVIADLLAVFTEERVVNAAWLEAAAQDRHFADLLGEVRASFITRVARTLARLDVAAEHDPVVAARALVAMVESFALDDRDGGDRHAVVATLASIWDAGVRALRTGE